jgi:hypothetical protein
MRSNKTAFAIIAVLLLLTTASFAQRHGQRGARGWQYLGEAHVDGRSDHDNISVRGGAFRSLQLRVENAPIEFDHVIVHYENGRAEELRVRQVIRPGAYTRNIDLRGDRRSVRSVELYYGKAAPRSARPRVTLYGQL